MEHLLREQRTALEKLLAEHQESVQQLFIQHQEVLQCFLTEARQQPLPSPLLSKKKAAPTSGAAQRSNVRDLSVFSSEGSSDEEETSGFGALQPSKHDGNLRSLVQSNTFQGVMVGAIILNTMFLGYRIHVEIMRTLNKINGEDHPYRFLENDFDKIAIVFVILFTAEMVLRIFAEKGQFFCGEGKYWNAFELLCLASMVVELLPEKDSIHMLEDFSTLRLFRLLRIFRAAQAVRLLQFLRQLRVMVYSFLSCAVSMFWALLLLAIIICLYALYLEDTSLVYLKETYDEINSAGPQSAKLNQNFITVKEDLGKNWNGMGSAVRSLFYSISGGADWGDLAAPFWIINSCTGFSYMAFVILMIFGLLNILVGIFVQEADTKKAQEEISVLFDAVDLDKSGELTLEELTEALAKDTIAAQFSHVGMDVERVDVLFRDFDVNGDGRISKDEFIKGFRKLQLHVTATDVASLLRVEEQNTSRKMDQLKEYISRRIDSLQDKLVTHGYHG